MPLVTYGRGLRLCCLGISNDGLRRDRREERPPERGGHNMDDGVLRRGRVCLLLLMFVDYPV